MDTPKIHITKHARERGQMRGVQIKTMILAILFGKKSRVPGDLFQKVLIKACIEKARKAGFAIQDIEAAVNVPVICDENDPQNTFIVTVLEKTKLRKKN